uniref:Uncharacterized protein n=1 Tax=Solanum tuberosum TaxID=4113 RepID=M0ZUB6_SOLTU
MLLVELVEAMVVRIIGRFERGDDDLCQFLFPSELINRAFEVIQPVSWRGMLPDFLVIFAAMAWLDSLCLHSAFTGALNVAGGSDGGHALDFLVVFAAMAMLDLILHLSS